MIIKLYLLRQLFVDFLALNIERQNKQPKVLAYTLAVLVSRNIIEGNIIVAGSFMLSFMEFISFCEKYFVPPENQDSKYYRNLLRKDIDEIYDKLTWYAHDIDVYYVSDNNEWNHSLTNDMWTICAQDEKLIDGYDSDYCGTGHMCRTYPLGDGVFKVNTVPIYTGIYSKTDLKDTSFVKVMIEKTFDCNLCKIMYTKLGVEMTESVKRDFDSKSAKFIPSAMIFWSNYLKLENIDNWETEAIKLMNSRIEKYRSRGYNIIVSDEVNTEVITYIKSWLVPNMKEWCVDWIDMVNKGLSLEKFIE